MKEEKNFDELEQFLQSEADSQTMYPSDSVWSNISKQIQPKRSWPALTIISLFILGSLGIATLMNYPPENPLNKIHFSVTKNQAQVNKNTSPTAVSIKSSLHHELEVSTTAINKRKEAKSVSLISGNTNLLSFNQLASDLSSIKKDKQESVGAQYESLSSSNKPFEKGILEAIANNDLSGHQPVINKKLKKNNTFTDADNASVADNLKGKLDYEVYGTPSFSFRTLAEDRFANSGSTTSSANKKVNQRAGLGSELGVGLRYKSSKDFTLKVGLQFNIRQYYIDAYSSQGLATIEVLQNNKLDSINVASKYGNSMNGTATRLTNRLYQVSVPIGIEWNAFNTKHIGLSLSASIQPTFSLNKNVYIISTDYKYYANGESLFRKWNVNSALSADFSYKLKNTTLYVGPQIRYQHLPTYVDKYPIKEYRVDYGIRVGVIKSLR